MSRRHIQPRSRLPRTLPPAEIGGDSSSDCLRAHSLRNHLRHVGSSAEGSHVSVHFEHKARLHDLKWSTPQPVVGLRLRGVGVLLKIISQELQQVRYPRPSPGNRKNLS